MSELIQFLNKFNAQSEDELIDYLNEQYENPTCEFFKLLPICMIDAIISIINDLTCEPLNDLLKRYQKYKSHEIRCIKKDIISELLEDKDLYILFVFYYGHSKEEKEEYDYDYCVENMHYSEFTVIVKKLNKQYHGIEYEIIDYMHLNKNSKPINKLYINNGNVYVR